MNGGTGGAQHAVRLTFAIDIQGRHIMFGKTKDGIDIDTLDASGGVFGDEEAAEQNAQLDELHERVATIETQIRSQFTSMAAYAQIAQEQIDLARAESKAENNRTEHRLTELIERERADRIEAIGCAPAQRVPSPSAQRIDTAATARLDALEAMTAELSRALGECLTLQKSLAEAIAGHFARTAVTALEAAASPEQIDPRPQTPAAGSTSDRSPAPLPAPTDRPTSSVEEPIRFTIPPLFGSLNGDAESVARRVETVEQSGGSSDGPIAGLSLAG
jgi:hypothetical protein